MGELSAGRFVANPTNVLLFGPPGVAISRAAVAAGYSVLFVMATDELIAALDKAQIESCLAEKVTRYVRAKLLIIDELGYLPFVPHSTCSTGHPRRLRRQDDHGVAQQYDVADDGRGVDRPNVDHS